jgi:DNA polymerase I
MADAWLIFDCDFLCHRAFHAMGSLSHAGEMTGVIYGFLRDLVHLREVHYTDRVVFAFDHGVSKRKQLLSTYKGNRLPRTEEEESLRGELRRQINLLKRRYLPDLGFRNVFYEDGYEADDVIASVCRNSLPKGDVAIVVSADKDLYQLLEKDRVIVWDVIKKRPYTEEKFRKEYGVAPAVWKQVKAIAGCNSDCVPGVRGVGDKTAAKFLAGNLPASRKTAQAISEFVLGGGFKRNLPLVRLPFKGCPTFELREDEYSEKNWNALADRLGMVSLKKSSRREGRLF